MLISTSTLHLLRNKTFSPKQVRFPKYFCCAVKSKMAKEHICPTGTFLHRAKVRLPSSLRSAHFFVCFTMLKLSVIGLLGISCTVSKVGPRWIRIVVVVVVCKKLSLLLEWIH